MPKVTSKTHLIVPKAIADQYRADYMVAYGRGTIVISVIKSFAAQTWRFGAAGARPPNLDTDANGFCG